MWHKTSIFQKVKTLSIFKYKVNILCIELQFNFKNWAKSVNLNKMTRTKNALLGDPVTRWCNDRTNTMVGGWSSEFTSSCDIAYVDGITMIPVCCLRCFSNNVYYIITWLRLWYKLSRMTHNVYKSRDLAKISLFETEYLRIPFILIYTCYKNNKGNGFKQW